jgi:hypothetical protein
VTSTLYVIAAVLIVIAVVLLVVLGASVGMAALLGSVAAVAWLGPRLVRLARRAREATGRLVRDVREPSGRHRRIGALPAPCGPEVPPRPDTPPVVWIDPDADDTRELPKIQETAA